MAWPGTYPSGGPLPQVHDMWRAGAPAIDILAPDLYLEYFDEVCERFTRNGNPLFIPETAANPANVITAFVKSERHRVFAVLHRAERKPGQRAWPRRTA